MFRFGPESGPARGDLNLGKVTHLLSLTADAAFPEKLIYPLEHAYTAAELGALINHSTVSGPRYGAVIQQTIDTEEFA